jgi:Ca2+-binding RTX toxin-like protein
MFRVLKSLLGVPSQPARRKRRKPASRRRLLGLETLETRDLMAVGVINLAATQQLQPVALTSANVAVIQQSEVVAPKAVTISIENHDLVIRGTDGPDDVKVSYQDGKFVVTVTTLVNDRAIPTSTNWRPTGGDVFFYGYKGNDVFSTAFDVAGYLRVNADGGDGSDNLAGSWGMDNLKGGNGDDTLKGHGSHDIIDGGNGTDDIDGGDGNDTIWCGADFAPNGAIGGPGSDTITGGYGPDTLCGGSGNDTIDGSYGSDSLFGDDDDDTLIAGNDSDYNYLGGGGGHDKLYGSYGDDDMFGNGGNDALFGGNGDDYLNGGDGFDRLYGGDGDDTLDGGNDGIWDNLYGQGGRDTFYTEFTDGGAPGRLGEVYDWQETEIVYIGGIDESAWYYFFLGKNDYHPPATPLPAP